MKIATYLLVVLICGCSAKRKLTASSVVDTENITEAQNRQASMQRSQSYSLALDSANNTNFLKLFPRGEFVISKDGFLGSADSLIWYNNAQQVNKQQQLEQQQQAQSNNEVQKQVEKQMVKEQKKGLLKASLPFWWVLAGAALICMVLLLKGRTRRI